MGGISGLNTFSWGNGSRGALSPMGRMTIRPDVSVGILSSRINFARGDQRETNSLETS